MPEISGFNNVWVKLHNSSYLYGIAWNSLIAYPRGRTFYPEQMQTICLMLYQRTHMYPIGQNRKRFAVNLMDSTTQKNFDLGTSLGTTHTANIQGSRVDG